MPPGSAATLRRLGRRAMGCLLLGAVLQYAVAVTCSLVPGDWGAIDPAQELHFADSEPTYYLMVARYSSVEWDALTGELFVYGSAGRDATAPADLDWRGGGWLNDETLEFNIEDPPAGVPSWSRFTQLRSDSGFDYYPGAIISSFGFEVATGWPRRCASYFAVTSDEGTPWNTREGIALSIPTNPPFEELPRVIPLKIYWPGALLNTLLYAAVIFVPLALIPLIRDHLRRCAGRCAACGYDLRGASHSNCPECGAPLQSQAAT